MKSASKTENEKERLLSLESYNILDTPSDASFDSLTEMAANICKTPLSFISFIDDTRVWCKSTYGVELVQLDREISFCENLIDHKEGIFMIKDSRKDSRFNASPLVTGNPKFVFYASFPLQNKKGITIGNLCVIDYVPRELSEVQIKTLKAITNQAMELTEYHKSKYLNLDLNEKNEELERFAYIAAHDIKGPLNNIYSLTSLLTELYASDLDEEGLTIINHINNASTKLKKLIDGILEYSKNPTKSKSIKTNIETDQFQKELIDLLSVDDSVSVSVKTDLKTIYVVQSAVFQILLNLIENAIKYNDKKTTKITIGISETEEDYNFYVEDNGPGVAPEQQEKIFEIFKTVASKDKFGQSGNGIGLATVKKLITHLGGDIFIKSNLGEGSKFIFNLKK